MRIDRVLRTRRRPLAHVERLRESHGFSEGPRVRLVLAFKHSYFAVRALQDGLYRAIYELSEGKEPSSKKSSMSRALRQDDAVRAWLGASSDPYLEWFKAWRRLRDHIKLGRPGGIIGPESSQDASDNVGINLATVTPANGLTIDLSRGTPGP